MNAAWEKAITSGHVEAVRALLGAGENVNARDRHGQTALMLAAHRGDRAVVEVLIAAGAELDTAAKHNLTALMLAIVAGHQDVARLLLRAGTDVDVRGTGAPGFVGKTAYDLAQEREMRDLCADLGERSRP